MSRVAAANGAGVEDYPDTFPPVLVKELRQGFRGLRFVVPFLLAHVGALSGLVIDLGEDRTGGAGMQTFGIFMGSVFVGVLPLARFGALNEEIRKRKLEIIGLTGTTVAALFFAKWAVSALMVGLIAVSLLPYFLAIYILGTVELEFVLVVVFWVVGCSLGLIALVLGATAGRGPVKGGFLVAYLAVGFAFSVAMFAGLPAADGDGVWITVISGVGLFFVAVIFGAVLGQASVLPYLGLVMPEGDTVSGMCVGAPFLLAMTGGCGFVFHGMCGAVGSAVALCFIASLIGVSMLISMRGAEASRRPTYFYATAHPDR